MFKNIFRKVLRFAKKRDAASLHHCITASLHHCITASLHRIRPVKAALPNEACC
jgi:hypothetical protein